MIDYSVTIENSLFTKNSMSVFVPGPTSGVRCAGGAIAFWSISSITIRNSDFVGIVCAQI